MPVNRFASRLCSRYSERRSLRPELFNILLVFLLVGGPLHAQVNPAITFGNATVTGGGTITLPISVTSAGTVAGLDLRLEVDATAGAPPVVATFSSVPATQSWTPYTGANDALHYILVGTQGVASPAQLAQLTIKVSPYVVTPVTYTFRVKKAAIANTHGVEQNLTLASGTAQVSVTPLAFGDFNGNGSVDAGDVNLALQTFLGLRTPTSGDLTLGDVRPKPGNGVPFGDGAITSTDVNWLFRRFLGLETAP